MYKNLTIGFDFLRLPICRLNFRAVLRMDCPEIVGNFHKCALCGGPVWHENEKKT